MSENTNEKQLSRRNFLKNAELTEGSGQLV